jgi:hypothetical protein
MNLGKFLTIIEITSLDYQVQKRNYKILVCRYDCLDLDNA